MVEEKSEKIKQIFDSIPDEILVMDNDMKILEANETFLRNNGLKIENVRGRLCYEVEQKIRGTCKVEVEDCPFFKVMERKVSCSQVRKHLDEDGNVRYAAIVGAPVIDSNGEIVAMMEMTRDITHRILLEEELKATELRIQQFMEMAPISTYVKDLKGRYVEVNPATCELLGRTKNEIIGKSDREILPRMAAELMCKEDKDVLQSKKAVRFETVLEMRGRRVFFSTVKYPVLDPEGNVTAVCGLSEDITAQKTAEIELKRTSEYLQNIMDNSPVLIITTDMEGNIVSFNRGSEEALGYTAGEITGRKINVIYEKPEERETMLRRVKSEGSIRDHQTHLLKKDKSSLFVSVTLSQLKDSSGNMIGTVGMAKDISHRKALMDQIMQSERQAAVGRLASGVAHEINNPLAMISEIAGYLDDLASGGPGAEGADLMKELREGLPKILEHVKKGRSITHRLLSFARKSEVHVESADVNACLEEIMPFLEKEAGLSRISLHREYEKDLARIAIEEIQLQEIFINLVKNSIQSLSSEGGGKVWISTSSKSGKVSISVRDNGPGIAEEVRDRLFDPFVTTKPPGQGTGLGLSICYGIVKRYDGEIRVESEKGKGAEFEVIFPALKSSGRED